VESPYVGFFVKVPRKVGTIEAYYEDNGISSKHAADFRFYTNSFSLGFARVIEPQRVKMRAAGLVVPDEELTIVCASPCKPNGIR
jgi:hypothetical protein